ncbi:MAG: leucine-rich repeat protein [Clostridiales Family XIII bacterium]|nr:leucine-rich repeat protein [Clostridiales Family XIII bacterium]
MKNFKILAFATAVMLIAGLCGLISVSAADTPYTDDGGFGYSLHDDDTATVTSFTSAGAISVTIPQTVFYNDKPYTVTKIAKAAFGSNTTVVSVTIPETVTTIEAGSSTGNTNSNRGAFHGCINLISVTFSGDAPQIETVGAYAFYNCSALTNITIPAHAPDSAPQGGTIGNYAFYGCSQLTGAAILAPVTTLGTYAFYNCTALSSVTLPETLTVIGDYAFYQSRSLAEIELPSTLNRIGASAFRTCTSLKSIDIPSSVSSIGNDAFRGATALRRVSVPAAVTSIGTNVFNGCTSLEHLYFLGMPPTFDNMNAFTNVGDDTVIYYPSEYNAQWTEDITVLVRFQDRRPLIGATVNLDLGYGGKTGKGYAGGRAGSSDFYVIRPLNPAREGYVFSGWYTDDVYTEPFNFNREINAGESVTLFAEWIDEGNEQAGGFQLVQEWSAEHEFFSFAVASDGTVYAGKESSVRAFDADGREKPGFSVDIADLSINYGGTTSERMCMLSLDGRECPTIVSLPDTFFILDPETGELIYKAVLYGSIEGLPAAGPDGNIYVVASEYLYALNPDEESYLWRASLGQRDTYNLPFFAFYGDDRVFVEIDQEVWGFDGEGRELWHKTGPVKVDNRSALSHELLVNPSNGTVYWSVPQRRLDALDPDTGTVFWSLDARQTLAQYPLYSADYGKLLMNIDGRLTEIDPDTGAPGQSHAPAGSYGVWNGGYLYTATNIYNEDLRVVATYNEANEAVRRGDFHLDGSGNMYRAIGAQAFNTTALEKVRLYEDTGDAVVYDIRLNVSAELALFPGKQTQVRAAARNQGGILLSGQTFEWESSNTDIAEVSYSNNGATATVSAKTLGTAQITVKAANSAVSRSFTAVVREEPRPVSMYFYWDTLRGVPEEAPPRVESVETYAYEALPHLRIYAQDQYGNFYDSMKVEWDTPNIGAALYQDGSGNSNIKYGAGLTFSAPVDTYVKAAAVDYPELQCQIPVTIKQARVRKVWSFEPYYSFQSDSRDFDTYFALNAGGTAIYLTASGGLSSLSASGRTNWSLSRSDFGGIYLSAPKVGGDANIYLTENYNNQTEAYKDRHMYKVSPDGKSLTQSTWTKHIKDFVTDGSYIYVLTVENEIYYANDSLELLWEGKPAATGSGDIHGAFVYGDSLYAAIGDSVYKVKRDDGETELLYRDARVNLTLEGIDADGNMLLQRNATGRYSLVHLSLGGSVNWTRALDRHVFAAPVNGEIYFVEDGAGAEVRLYILEKDGGERLETSFSDRADSAGDIMLAVGPDGIVYIATSQLNALSPEGELLWQFPTLPGDPYYPYTKLLQIASVANNTLISSCGQGPMGTNIMATQGIPRDDINVSMSGGDTALPGAFKDLRIEVTNYRETTNAELEITLWDISAERALSRTAFADTLINGRQNVYDCGAMIPSSGNLKLIVNIKDAEGSALYSKEIAVRQQ